MGSVCLHHECLDGPPVDVHVLRLLTEHPTRLEELAQGLGDFIGPWTKGPCPSEDERVVNRERLNH